MRLHFIRGLGTALLDFVFPPQCLGCEGAMEEAGGYLCPGCWGRVVGRTTPGCRRCSSPYAAEGVQCGNCASWEPAFERAIVLGDFDEVLQQAVHALKFRQQPGLGVALGRRLGTLPVLSGLLREVDVLVPVPLHGARQRERGYNQSEYIARGLAEVLGKPLCGDLLRRQTNTRQQAKLDARERKENLVGAFAVVGEVPPHHCIGLVDDVVTTGATLNACTQALQQAGTRRVWALALASPFHR